MNAKAKRRCILFFVRAPQPGAVKTRLARDLGPTATLDLYRAFVADTLEKLAAGGDPLVVCYAPARARLCVERWLGEARSYQPQHGADLGARMAAAFADAFAAGWEQAILVGSDLPDLDPALTGQAFKGLARCGSVLGPTLDGGYYLVGFTRDAFRPGIFAGVPWGTPAVFARTLAACGGQGLTPALLPAWRDIDDIDDLRRLAASNNAHRRAPHTWRCLRANGLA